MQFAIDRGQEPSRFRSRAITLGGRGWVLSHSSLVGSLPWSRARSTHELWAWRRRWLSPSGAISMCSLSAGR